MKKIILGALLAAALPAMAQQDMYLIKDTHVVAKYNVDDVDYVSFSLPEGVVDNPLWIETGNVAKNSLTYSVNTTSPLTAYAHGIVAWNTLNNYALSYYDDEFNNLPEGTQILLMQAALQQVGYLGMGNNEYTMTDWQDDGTGNDYYTSRFSVRGGLKYYVMAQEVDINTQEPGEAFYYTTVETPAPAASPFAVDVKVISAADEEVTLDFSGCDDNILYCLVAIMPKSSAEFITELYGADYIFNTWAYPWDLAELKQDATWNVFDSGEYTVMVRGVDDNGDIADCSTEFTYTSASDGAGPKINFSQPVINGSNLSLNFEITPSNVTEAYVYLDTEDNIDDLKNDGWELWEIASRSTATDISYQINTTGEYTYTHDFTDEGWYSLLVYAKDDEGNKTVARVTLNYFNNVLGNFWDVTNPAKAPLHKAPAFKSRAPRTLKKIQK